jgi:hypothetical protein
MPHGTDIGRLWNEAHYMLKEKACKCNLTMFDKLVVRREHPMPPNVGAMGT